MNFIDVNYSDNIMKICTFSLHGYPHINCQDDTSGSIVNSVLKVTNGDYEDIAPQNWCSGVVPCLVGENGDIVTITPIIDGKGISFTARKVDDWTPYNGRHQCFPFECFTIPGWNCSEGVEK